MKIKEYELCKMDILELDAVKASLQALLAFQPYGTPAAHETINEIALINKILFTRRGWMNKRLEGNPE